MPGIYDILKAYGGADFGPPKLHLPVPEDGGQIMLDVLANVPDTNALKRSLYDVERPVRNNDDGSYSTHLMSTMEADGNHYMFPRLQFDSSGNPIEQNDSTARVRAIQNGLVIPFASADEAHDASIRYKDALSPYFTTNENTDNSRQLVNEKAAMLYDSAIRNGATPAQAAGLVGNADVESARFRTPNAKRSFFHIEGPKMDELQQWYESHGYEPSIEHEGEFVTEWMNNPDRKTQWDELPDNLKQQLLDIKPYDNVDTLIKYMSVANPSRSEQTLKNIYRNYLNYTGDNARDDWNSRDPKRAAKAIMAVFERPGVPHEDRRKDRANEASLNPAVTGNRFASGGIMPIPMAQQMPPSPYDLVSKEEKIQFLSDVFCKTSTQGVNLSGQQIREIFNEQWRNRFEGGNKQEQNLAPQETE